MTTPFERLVSLLNLRTLTFVLGVCLALAVPSYPALQWLDATLASLATTLTNDPTYLSWIQGTGPVTANWWLQAADLPGLVTHSAGAPPDWGVHPHVPWWFYPARSLLVLALTAYLCLLVPRLRLCVAVLATLLLFIVLIVTQLIEEITRFFLLCFHVCVPYLLFHFMMICIV